MSNISDSYDSIVNVTDEKSGIQLGLVELFCLEACKGKGKVKDQRAISSALYRLNDYTQTQFISQELLMRMRMYDDYAEHVKDHTHVLELLRAVSIDRMLGTTSLISGNVDRILQFIGNHVATRDRRFTEHLLREIWN